MIVNPTSRPLETLHDAAVCEVQPKVVGEEPPILEIRQVVPTSDVPHTVTEFDPVDGTLERTTLLALYRSIVRATETVPEAQRNEVRAKILGIVTNPPVLHEIWNSESHMDPSAVVAPFRAVSVRSKFLAVSNVTYKAPVTGRFVCEML